ncbi:MAG: tRNA uridine-5-carboxymethylaminomethyl(34) synthesis GTPase MnmE [Ktedonobacterales bacterium]
MNIWDASPEPQAAGPATYSETGTGNETIAAVATPPGAGAIGIVRLSGPEAIAIGHTLFRKSGKPESDGSGLASHLLTHGYVVDYATGERIDEVLAAFMLAPRTYTREDVVEFQAHGGPLILRRILELALAAGARAAQPGEMTLRAFLNGRLDLAQAEAVMALIGAESEAGRRVALRQLQGELSRRIALARGAVMGALAQIEASIDFPEEEVPAPEKGELARLLAQARNEIERLLEGANRGRILREGLRVALVGRPNVGKSSLLNALLGTERAIVTPFAGTTRDTIEERATIAGIPVQLVDTAGLSTTNDPIESIGVERSRQAARSADLLLFVLDAGEPLQPLDQTAATELQALFSENAAQDGTLRPTIGVPAVLLVLNKADLPRILDERAAQRLWEGAPLVHSSTLSHEGMAALEEAIYLLVLGGEARGSETLVTSVRHSDALRRAMLHLVAADQTLAGDLPLDFLSIDLRSILETLGEITGETATDDLLERIFSEFCIGK